MKTFGYLHILGLLRASIPIILSAFDEVMAVHGGCAYSGEHRLTVPGGLARSAALSQALLDASPLIDLLSTLLGQDYQYWGSEISYCSGDTPWHTDSPPQPEWRMSEWCQVFVCCDRVDECTGALRVIPGSHHADDAYANGIVQGILADDGGGWVDTAGRWGVRGAEVPAVSLRSDPGDVIVINYLTAHASFGGADRRRLLTAKFFPSLSGDRLELLERLIRRRSYSMAELFGEESMLTQYAPESRMGRFRQLMEFL